MLGELLTLKTGRYTLKKHLTYNTVVSFMVFQVQRVVCVAKYIPTVQWLYFAGLNFRE